MHVFELARPMTDGVQILLLEREEVFREALVREARAHALPGRELEPHLPLRAAAHGPGVGRVGPVGRARADASDRGGWYGSRADGWWVWVGVGGYGCVFAYVCLCV